MKLYIAADTMAQWYFLPRGGSTGAGSSSSAEIGKPSAAPRRASVRLAFRHCVTSSFGSVAFAAAILTIIRALRRTMERCARNNIVCCILNCLIQARGGGRRPANGPGLGHNLLWCNPMCSAGSTAQDSTTPTALHTRIPPPFRPPSASSYHSH